MCRVACLLCLILIFTPFCLAADDAALRAALKLGNYYLLKQDWRQARATLRKAIQRDPENETLWLAYDNVIRQEAGQDPVAKTDVPALSEPYATGYEAELVDPPAVQQIRRELQAASREKLLRTVDFTAGLGEDFSVVLSQDLQREDGRGIRFPARGGGSLLLSFELGRFPREAELVFRHRVDRPAGRLRLVPLQVLINDKRLFVRPLRVPGATGESRWKCTDLLKTGSNLIELRLSGFATEYILAGVSLKLEP